LDAPPLEPAAELRSLEILTGGRVSAQATFDIYCQANSAVISPQCRSIFQYPGLTQGAI
jgi:hypothetical protein